MKRVLLLPAIDLKHGRCVRLYQGDFASETRYAVEPEALVARYRALGAPWLHVVDLDGARDGARGNWPLIATLAAQRSVRLQVGGGVRSTAAVAELLAAGVARVVVGSLAVEQPAQVTAWLSRFGSEQLCLAFDVRLDADGVPWVRTRGWTQDSGLTLWEALAKFPRGLVRHVLCTDTERDGAMQGPNVALYCACLRGFPRVLWQASGGVRGRADLEALAAAGVAAAVSGKALLEDRIASEELRPYLPGASFPASTSATAGS